jgi:hypothetical protein
VHLTRSLMTEAHSLSQHAETSAPFLSLPLLHPHSSSYIPTPHLLPQPSAT